MDKEDLTSPNAVPLLSEEHIYRHEAINIALLDIAALERIVEESQAPIPLDLLQSLKEDFLSLDDLHRQFTTGLEDSSLTTSKQARQVEEEQKEIIEKLEDTNKHLDTEKRKIKKCEEQIKGIATEASGIDEEIEQLREDVIQEWSEKNAEEESERLREVAAALEAETEALEAHLADVEAKISHTLNEHERQEARKAKIDKSVQELKEKIDEIDQHDKQFEKETMAQISQVEKQIQQRGEEMKNIHDQKINLQEELQRWRTMTLAKEAEAERLQAEAERLEAELLRREEANAQARAVLDALTREREELQDAEHAQLASAQAEEMQLREETRLARAELGPAKRRLRRLRQEVLAAEQTGRERRAQGEEKLRQARRRLQLEKDMVESMERSVDCAYQCHEQLAVDCEMLREAIQLSNFQHAQRMEAFWWQSKSLDEEQVALLESIASLELKKERLNNIHTNERSTLNSLLEDIAALSETALSLQKEEEKLDADILDIKVALATQVPNVQEMTSIYESLCRL